MKCLILLALFGSATAQVENRELRAIGLTNKVGPSSYYNLPALNRSLIQAWRVMNGQGLETKVGGFAVPTPVSVNSNEHGLWEEGLWRITFRASDSLTKGMYLAFDQFFLPEGSALFMYSETGAEKGAFTSANNKPNKQFMITPIDGQEITLEYNSLSATEKPILSIDLVGQAYSYFPGSEMRGPSGWCNINVACPETNGWQNEVNSGAILMTSSGGGYCSGNMINNYQGKQYFLTAFHCRPSSRDAVGFNFEESTCNGDDGSIGKNSAQGLTTVSSTSSSDFHLMEVDENIPSSYNAYLAGWNSNDMTTSDDTVCISHPSADRKKWARSYGQAVRSGYGGGSGTNHWHVKAWNEGTTEGGSSGSALFNSNKEILGQLHGGQASCNYNFNDYYGALAASWSGTSASTRLYDHLSGNQNVRSMAGASL